MTLYRTFPKAEYADDFMKGKVFISTLKRCREMEDKIRQDPGEGTMTYHSGVIDGRDQAASRIIRERFRFNTEGRVNFCNNTFMGRVPDAFIFCQTRTFAPKFGEHVVRIDYPRLLFRVMSKALGAFDGTEKGWMKSVQYRDRVYAGLEPTPDVGFIKPVQPFAKEREVRMVWPRISGKSVRPDGLFEITCPDAARHCTRLPYFHPRHHRSEPPLPPTGMYRLTPKK